MARWQHYEVYVQQGDRWNLLGSYINAEAASAVARARWERVRRVRVTFVDSTRIREEVLVETAAIRKAG
jgi:1,2-phenylacetyl-CoA epoxidase PaaB subunit